MFGKKHSKPQNRIDSLIGSGTTIYRYDIVDQAGGSGPDTGGGC